MADAEVVTILPSRMNSYKVANIGRVIGTISQDRLSAVYGEVGRLPAMIPVEVSVPNHGSTRTLRFEVVRQPELAPLITAAGLAQGILGSNDAGLAEGFRVRREVTFPEGPVSGRQSLRRTAGLRRRFGRVCERSQRMAAESI